MNRVTFYWIGLILILMGISYLYALNSDLHEPFLQARHNEHIQFDRSQTLQIGDLHVIKANEYQVKRFFKIAGFSTNQEVLIIEGNPTYYQNFNGAEDWIRKGIERGTYFNPEVQAISRSSLKQLVLDTNLYTVYRLNYQPENYPVSFYILYSPITVLLFILFLFLIFWLADWSSIYVNKKINYLSPSLLFGFISFILITLISWGHLEWQLLYVRNQENTNHLNIFYISIESIIVALPFFIFYRFFVKRYLKQLPFADREFCKFLIIILPGLFYMLIVILITTWLRTQHSDHPALYLRKEQFFFFLSEGFISFSIIAIANFLNNLRQHIQQLKLKETKLGTTEKLALSSQSELNALQARINPHFLYNSLNSIASLAQINPAKTEEMAIALSEFYRYSTNRKEQHFHTVEEEIKLLTNYLSIEKNRFGAILQYKLQIDPKTSKAEIPRFLLQPLVENAIKYGFNKKKNEIKVRIKVEAIGNCLHLIVSDSGPSFTTEMDAGYGLRSIKKKLKLFYPEHHEISFENAPEKQVHIILVTS